MRKSPLQRISFSKISSAVDIPDLLDIQIRSFREFLQDDVLPEKRECQGLQEVFESLFPVMDSRENYLLEFEHQTRAVLPEKMRSVNRYNHRAVKGEAKWKECSNRSASEI